MGRNKENKNSLAQATPPAAAGQPIDSLSMTQSIAPQEPSTEAGKEQETAMGQGCADRRKAKDHAQRPEAGGSITVDQWHKCNRQNCQHDDRADPKHSHA